MWPPEGFSPFRRPSNIKAFICRETTSPDIYLPRIQMHWPLMWRDDVGQNMSVLKAAEGWFPDWFFYPSVSHLILRLKVYKAKAFFFFPSNPTWGKIRMGQPKAIREKVAFCLFMFIYFQAYYRSSFTVILFLFTVGLWDFLETLWWSDRWWLHPTTCEIRSIRVAFKVILKKIFWNKKEKVLYFFENLFIGFFPTQSQKFYAWRLTLIISRIWRSRVIPTFEDFYFSSRTVAEQLQTNNHPP